MSVCVVGTERRTNNSAVSGHPRLRADGSARRHRGCRRIGVRRACHVGGGRMVRAYSPVRGRYIQGMHVALRSMLHAVAEALALGARVRSGGSRGGLQAAWAWALDSKVGGGGGRDRDVGRGVAFAS